MSHVHVPGGVFGGKQNKPMAAVSTVHDRC